MPPSSLSQIQCIRSGQKHGLDGLHLLWDFVASGTLTSFGCDFPNLKSSVTSSSDKNSVIALLHFAVSFCFSTSIDHAMPSSDSPTLLVARYLRSNNYTQTLDAFLLEAGLDTAAADSRPGDWTIDQILQEKKQFDTALNFEKRGHDDDFGWTQPAPAISQSPQGHISSNAVCVYGDQDSIYSTHVDRSLLVTSTSSPFDLSRLPQLTDSTILSIAPWATSHLLLTTLSGSLHVYSIDDTSVVNSWKHHAKHAIQVITYTNQHAASVSGYVATAGNDNKVLVFASPLHSSQFDKALETITLQTPPVSIVFARHPDTDVLHLIVARQDSSKLDFYSVTHYQVQYTGTQNLAPHSNTWVVFSPSSIAICPTDPTLLAVGTSQTPSMKLILVRLLFPHDASGPATSSEPQRPATQARAALAKADREEAAILLQVSTMAPQTDYSNPQIVWRPDGSGVWVNGDDGAVRGIEAKTGKVVTTLKGHDPATKVRTLWAGKVPDERGGKREVLVSGGFDKKVLIWKCE